VDDVGDRVADPAHGVAEVVELLLEELDLRLVGEKELHVVAAREAEVAVAVLVGEVGELPDGGDGQEARAGRAHGVQLVPGLPHVQQHAGLGDFVVGPFPVVLLHDGRKELLVVGGADVGLSIRGSHVVLLFGPR